ncbi:Protein memo1 [Dimargaris xerosporica]|nr:Protein memo1 [Dimargaris xerosporica]
MDALTATGHFTQMSQSVDEEEHSIEMQLPYLYKMLKILGKETSIKIVPILVGALSDKREKLYGELLAPYLADHDNFFVISSDFCHWGTRFRYTFYSPDDKPSTYPGNVQDFKVHPLPIYRAVENLDREGMAILETLSYDAFIHYLDVTSNTICGRHPIGVLLCAVEHLEARTEKVNLRFVYYAQSSSVKTIRESSVSYASAYLTIAP